MTYEPKWNEYLMNGSIKVNKTNFRCVGNNDSLKITILAKVDRFEFIYLAKENSCSREKSKFLFNWNSFSS